MPDNFDPADLLAALDATEAAGVPPHLVEQLRALVLKEEDGRAGRLDVAGERIRTGQLVARHEDGRYYLYRPPVGASTADVEPGQPMPLVAVAVRFDRASGPQTTAAPPP